MEQKKILWIVIAVGVFVLIIFGTALILYSPDRSTGQAAQQAAFAAVPRESQTTQNQGSSIDPDSWVRDPETKPGLDSEITPAPGSINLTIVNGDNATASYSNIDVTGLTKRPQKVDTTGLAPQEIPGQTAAPDAQPTAQAEKQTEVTPTVEKAKPSAVKPEATATTKKQVTKKASTNPVKATAKPVTTTEYWIQAGSFSSKLNAEKARTDLAGRYLKAEIFTKTAGNATTYRVRIGPYVKKAEAEYWLASVKEVQAFSGSYISEVRVKK